jgi:hypothetical protein
MSVFTVTFGWPRLSPQIALKRVPSKPSVPNFSSKFGGYNLVLKPARRRNTWMHGLLGLWDINCRGYYPGLKNARHRIYDFSLYAYSIYPACFDWLMNELMTNVSPHQHYYRTNISLYNYWQLNVNIMQYIRLTIMIINLITFTLGLRSSGLLYGVCWYFLLTFLDNLSFPFSRVRQYNGQAVQLSVWPVKVGPRGCPEMSVTKSQIYYCFFFYKCISSLFELSK